MTFASKGSPPGHGGDPLELSSYGGVDLQANIPNQATAQENNRASEITRAAPREAKLELLREDIQANASIMQCQLNVALASIDVPDDVGLLYALRSSRAYWRAIARSARDVVALRAEIAAEEHFVSLPDDGGLKHGLAELLALRRAGAPR